MDFLRNKKMPLALASKGVHKSSRFGLTRQFHFHYVHDRNVPGPPCVVFIAVALHVAQANLGGHGRVVAGRIVATGFAVNVGVTALGRGIVLIP